MVNCQANQTLQLTAARFCYAEFATGGPAGQVIDAEPAAGRHSAVHGRLQLSVHTLDPMRVGAEEGNGPLLLSSFEVITRRRSTTMTATTRDIQTSARTSTLFVSFELGETSWKLAFTTGMGQRPRERTIGARDRAAVLREIQRAKQRFEVPDEVPVKSCYEAGRDGFWLHRWLISEGIDNRVVDASSIEVNRRLRRAKTDRLDATRLLLLLVRFFGGEPRVWSVERVPGPEEELDRGERRAILALETGPRSTPIQEFSAVFPCALLVGNERFGLAPAAARAADHRICIRTHGAKASLNVVAALGIALHALRDRFDRRFP